MVAPESVGFSSQRLERIKYVMQSYIDNNKIAGMSTMIAREGKIFQCEQYGYAEVETKKPMSPDAIFRLYSMTKPIIAVALMMLYEEGVFQLIEPISKYLPSFKNLKVYSKNADDKVSYVDPCRPVTICDLLKHTAGFTYDFLEDSPVGELYREAKLLNNASRSLEALVNDLAQLPLAYQPGSRWHYSLSMDVAAHLIEVLADQPLQVFLEERLFKPLGMKDTGFYLSPEKLPRLASMYGLYDLAAPGMTINKLLAAFEKGYRSRTDVSSTYPTSSHSFARGGHGLFGTTHDYWRFAEMLLNQGELNGTRILGRKTIELMHADHLSAALKPMCMANISLPGYGFGLGSNVLVNVAESEVPGSVGELSFSGAAKTFYWVDPVEKITAVFMCQEMMSFILVQQDFRALVYQALL